MPSMSEDAVFKALLKNKPPQTTQPEKAEAPVKNIPRASAASSEDALYKALLKNKPQQSQVQKAPPARIETPAPQIQKEPVVEAAVTPTPAPAQEQINQVAESIQSLNASVNLVYGLMKTAVIVMVLILIVGLASLVRG